jgi:hypothetical protein
MKRLKKNELLQLMIKLDYRGDSMLHNAIVVKLLNLGFEKVKAKTLKIKPDFYIFAGNGKFHTSYKKCVYNEKYTLVTLDDLYDLGSFVPLDTTITLANGEEIKLSKKSYKAMLLAAAVTGKRS